MTQVIQFAARDEGLALGFDIAFGDAEEVMPFDLVLPQLPHVCIGGLAKDEPTGGGSPPTAPTQICSPDYRFWTDIETTDSLVDGTATAIMHMSNPFGVGYGIRRMQLLVNKPTGGPTWHAADPDSHRGGYWGPPPPPQRVGIIHASHCHSHGPCLYVPAHCSLNSSCGGKIFRVEGSVAPKK